MADLGSTHYVGLSERLRTPAETFTTSFQNYGLSSNFPSSSFFENEIGDTYSVINRVSVPTVVRPAPQHVIYEMRGRDVDCATLTYRYWRSVGAADFGAIHYTGPKCGVSALADIVVIETLITA